MVRVKNIIIILAVIAAAAIGAFFYFSRVPAPATAGNASGDEMPKKNTRRISLYYYNSEIDKDAAGNVLCSRGGLVQTAREIPATETPIQDAINLLIKGDLTDNEKKAGLSSEFPLAGFSLKRASVDNNILTLEFDDPQGKTGGGACRASVLWYQIEATAKQFNPDIQVRFLPETLFQP